MKLWDFICEKCGRKLEYLQTSFEDVPFCCGFPMKKIFSACNFARFASGDRETPPRNPDGYELDLKKCDVFGRRFDDLPEEHNKTRWFWKKVSELEEIHRRPAPLEYKEKLADELFGKDIKVEEAE